MTITEAESTTPHTATGIPSREPGATIDLTERVEPSPARPTFTITDAAAACAVSRKTITRKLGDLALHGAAKDDDGIWRIPVEALLAVGLHPGRSLPSQPSAARPSPQPAPQQAPAPVDASGDVVTIPRHRWDDLRIRLARAEAEAAERALALADARLALRALTAGPSRAADSPVRADGGPAEPAPPSPVTVPGAAPSPIALSAGSASGAQADAPPVPDSSAAPGSPDPAAQLAAARTHAAQNGGYVPAAPSAPARKRRWWHAK